MKQELNDLFCPIELIEPTALSTEFQIIVIMMVECNIGYVCETGTKQ